MQFLNLTLDDLSENLALDEALLDRAEQHEADQLADLESGKSVEDKSIPDFQMARLWQPQQTAVILGRGSKVDEEVNRPFCREHQIPVFRRHSGGASVVIGPGSFLYSVVVGFRQHPELRDLNQAHDYVMTRVRKSLEPFVPELQIQGVCDLTFQQRKVSGNSLKVGRHHFMYHGTILYQFDLDQLAQCLLTPPRQPEYRQGRSHLDFVANLPVTDCETFESRFPQEFKRAWQATDSDRPWPASETKLLAAEKYSTDEWNFRR